MSAKFQYISSGDMDSFMDALGFEEVEIEGVNEAVYEQPYADRAKIRVYSTISGYSNREVGSDAIRVVGTYDDRVIHTETRVHRTQNWRKNMLARIDNIHRLKPIPRKCRGCGLGHQVPKKGRNGMFYGCTKYPKCRVTMKMEESQ